MVEPVRAPFPWPGGKSRVAAEAWRALGPEIVNYVEPFAGSLAMLLGRPNGPGKIETCNDLDGMICNFWRAVKWDPDATARWCDDPVSELDLHARHKWLVERIEDLAEQLRSDIHYFDPQVAGYWVNGICQWIGTGWCDVSKLERNAGTRPHLSGDNAGMGVLKQQLPDVAVPARARRTGKGVLSQQLPSLRVDSGATGNGIHASGKMPMLAVPGPGAGTEAGRGALSEAAALANGKLPLLSTNGSSGSKGVLAEGLSRQIPMLSVTADGSPAARGVLGRGAEQYERGLPAIGNDRGINGVSAPPCQAWFRALQERLRRVRIVCGDWTRVLGNSVLGKGNNVGGRRPCGVFLDPPYDPSLRAKKIYGHDAAGLSTEVRAWALAHGADPDLRIIVCGYWEEHQELLSAGWKAHRWKGARGYAAEDNNNREQETLFLSPFCKPIEVQRGLFEGCA